MPVLASLLRDAASQETVGPFGFFVTSNWPSIYTGTTPSRHQYLCGGHVRGGSYEAEWNAPAGGTERESLGCRVEGGSAVTVLDPPHAAVRPVNGKMAVEWGCHDRHTGAASFPASFGRALDETFGTYGNFAVQGIHSALCAVRLRAPRRAAPHAGREPSIARRPAGCAPSKSARLRMTCSRTTTGTSSSRCSGRPTARATSSGSCTMPRIRRSTRRSRRGWAAIRCARCTTRSTRRSASCSRQRAPTPLSTCIARTACVLTTTGSGCSNHCCGGSISTRRASRRPAISRGPPMRLSACCRAPHGNAR